MIIDTGFFDPAKGGDPAMFEHLHWFFGQPEFWLFFLKWLVIFIAAVLIAWRLIRVKRYLLLFVVIAAFLALIAVNFHIMSEAHSLFVEGRGHEAGKLKVINWVTTFLAYACICGFLFERLAKHRDS